jgi:hypothetical protein
MSAMSVRIDPETRRRMASIGDVNWAEVIRETVKQRLEIEEELRQPVDRRRARRGQRASDLIRGSLGPSHYHSVKEIRRWRDSRR